MITIKTRLHEGICKSDGGGDVREHYSWSNGPRNLMRAIESLQEHRREMTAGYGDVGHCGSWIEVDGVEMSNAETDDYYFNTDPANFEDYSHISAVSKTTWCRNYLQRVSK